MRGRFEVLRFGVLLFGVLLTSATPLLAQSGRAAPSEATADRITMSVRGAPVAEALDELVALSGMSLVYDPAITQSRRAFCQFVDAAPETVLRCITREAGLDFYRLSSGTYVVIASVTEAPRFASFAGVVLDAQTGEPLETARVSIDAGGDRAVSRRSNSAGAFAFPPVMPGSYRVRVNAVGYAPYRTTLRLSPGTPLRWRVPLRRLPVAMEMVAITGLVVPPIDDRVEVASVRTDSSVAMLSPGALFRAASNQLGVGQRALAGDLHIQGGEAGEHQFRIDGVPVFDPLSVARLFGSFSPLAVQRLTVRKAGFGVEHGSFTSGVIDLEHSLANGQSGATAVFDPYAVSARVSGATTVGGRPVIGMLTGRRSLWDVVPTSSVRNSVHDWSRVDRALLDRTVGTIDGLSPTTRFTTDVSRSTLHFTDLHGAMRAELGAFQSLSGSFYMSENDATTNVNASTPAGVGPLLGLVTREQFAWSTLGGQLRHEWLPTARLQQSVQLRYSDHVLHHRHAVDVEQVAFLAEANALRLNVAPSEMPREGNSISEVALEGTLRYLVRDGTTLSIGAEGARTRSTMDMNNRIFRPLQARNTAWRATQYTKLEQRLGQRVRLNAGLRLTWVPTFATVYAEPRLSIAGDHAGDGRTFSWRLASGVYRQYVAQFDLPAIGPTAVVSGSRFWLPVDGTIRPPESYHTAAEAVWQWSNGWELRAEGYAKWLTAIPSINYAALLNEETQFATPLRATQTMFIMQSDGRMLGGGVRMARRLDHWRTELGYDGGWSERRFPGRFGEQLQPTPWNEPHRLTATVEWQPRRDVNVSATSRSVFGRSWGLRRAYYDLALPGLPVGNPGADRLPAMHEVDFGASQALRVGAVDVALQLTVLNAFNRANVLDQWLDAAPGTGADATSTGANGYVASPRTGLGRQLLLTVRMQP